MKKKSLHHDLETIIPLLIGSWRRLHKRPGPPEVLQTREFREVVSAIKAFMENSYHGKSLLDTDYWIHSELLGAYLLYPWIIHYQEGLSLIGELPSSPKRVLDVCSGPGSFAFAALKHGAREVFATDRNLSALNLGAEICGRYGMALTIRKWDCLNEVLPIEGKFDLIILAHCVEELFPEGIKNWKEKQHEFILSLLHRLTPDGYLLLVDRSFLEVNRRLLSLRDQLVQEGIPIQAPCVWQGACPALKAQNSPCYAQRELIKPYLVREIQRAAQINLGSLKMTYLIFKHPKSSWPSLSKNNCYRVVSPPVESFRGKRYYLCGSDGKKNLGSRLKDHPPESRAFEFLRRGELITIEGGVEQNHHVDIVSGTKLSVIAACGKPIIEKVMES